MAPCPSSCPEGNGSPIIAGTATRLAAPTAGAVTVALNSNLPTTLLKGANSNKGAVSPEIAPEALAFSTAYLTALSWSMP